MNMIPKHAIVFDVPKEISRYTRLVAERSDLAQLGERDATFLLRTLNWFEGGRFVFAKHLREHDTKGPGRIYYRQEEAAEATRTAFHMAFGEGYDERQCKEDIRKAVEAEAFLLTRDAVSKGTKEKVRMFLTVWHDELEKLLAPTDLDH